MGNSIWQGAGGETKRERILEKFLAWAEENDNSLT